MDIKPYNLLLIFINITSFYPLVVAVTKTVYFHKKSDCEAYRHYVGPGETYEVVWNGEVYPKMCSIRFKMRGIDTYELCAKVTVFDMECERNGDERRLLKFYWGVAMKERVYDCQARLPIMYCNEDLLFMKLKPDWNDIRDSNSQIRITVTSTLVSRYDESFTTTSTTSSGSELIIVIVVVLISFLIITLCVVVIKRRAAARLRRNGGSVTIQQQRNNVFVTTSNRGQPAHSNQQNQGEQQVPLVEYGAAGRTQPGGLDHFRYPTVSSHPGYYREMHATAPPLNYYEGHTQLPSHVEDPSSHPPEFKKMRAPPPSYEDVMQNKKDY